MVLLCPCHSQQPYNRCCQRFHSGEQFPANALLLMRSRYAAYARDLVDYIIDTTHPHSPHFQQNMQLWKKDLFIFCRTTSFQHLHIIDFTDGAEEAYVTFFAQLKQRNADTSFVEKSHFLKQANRWFYYKSI